jgi:hypothetical protein
VDNDFNVDLDEIIATLRTQDVVIARFVTVPRHLLFDFRSSTVDLPLVKVVDPLPSVEARYRHLRELRPYLGDPPKLVSVFWPRFAASFGRTGAWDTVLARLAAAGDLATVRAAEHALAELVALESTSQHEAIRGGRAFRTLWSASPSPR